MQYRLISDSAKMFFSLFLRYGQYTVKCVRHARALPRVCDIKCAGRNSDSATVARFAAEFAVYHFARGNRSFVTNLPGIFRIAICYRSPTIDSFRRVSFISYCFRRCDRADNDDVSAGADYFWIQPSRPTYCGRFTCFLRRFKLKSFRGSGQAAVSPTSFTSRVVLRERLLVVSRY